MKKVMKSIATEQRERQLKQLRQIIGVAPTRSLQTTGILKIWKQGRTHMWWVESKKGEILWRSETRPGCKKTYPNLSMFYTTTLNIGNYLPERWNLKDEYR